MSDPLHVQHVTGQQELAPPDRSIVTKACAVKGDAEDGLIQKAMFQHAGRNMRILIESAVTNFRLQQDGFSASKDALAVEDATSEAAQTYANLLVVEEGKENEPAIKALVAALTSQTVKDYIDSTYDGAVVAVF